MGELVNEPKLTYRQKQAKAAAKAIGHIVFIAGCVSVLFSAVCVSILGIENISAFVGGTWVAYIAYPTVVLAVLGFCVVLDFFGIKRILGYGLFELFYFAITRSPRWGQIAAAIGAIILGGCFVAASGFTSYWGSKMAAGIMTSKPMETGTGAKNKAATKEYNTAIAPAQRRVDSLEAAKAEAIKLAAGPWLKSAAKGNRTSVAIVDSISRAKDRAFEKALAAATKNLEEAQALHGGLLKQTTTAEAALAKVKIETITAKADAVWGVMVFFGVGSIVVLTLGTALQAAISAIREAPASPTVVAKKKEEEDEDWSAYLDDALQAPKPQSRPKSSGGNGQSQRQSHSPNSNSIPFDLN
jgi:hypothetical protein